LVALAGPAAGEEFVLSGDEVVVGRASDNGVSIPDTSVSRKHVLLRRDGAGWAASDMGSGNGTMVNGAAISEETALKSGDVITLGDTELKFEDGSEAAGARRAPARRPGGPAPVNTGGYTRAVVRTSRKGAGEVADLKSQRRKLFIRVGAVLFVALGGAVAFRQMQTQQEAIKKKKDLADAEVLNALRLKKQEASTLIREGRWKEAKAKLVELSTEAPDFEPQQIGQWLSASEVEIPNQERLQEAADDLSKSEIAAAARALQQITKDTTQFARRDKLQAELDKRLGERLKDARALLGYPTDLAKMKELKAMVEDVLVASPENRDALAYKASADEAINRIEHPPPPRPKDPGKPWVAVQDRFQSGDQSGAYALAESCAAKVAQCKALKGQIAEFGDRLKKVTNNPDNINDIVALVELDRKITGGTPSPLSKVFVKKASDALCVKATNYKSSNWAAAIEQAKKALAVDPNSACATALIQEGKTKAKDRFLVAYTADNEDDKIKGYKEVIAMTPKDDEYHLKAQAKLAEMAR
jgi:tetratricopeptide (TPR) repeat protein